MISTWGSTQAAVASRKRPARDASPSSSMSALALTNFVEKPFWNGAVSGGDSEVRLSAARRPREDEVAAFRHELWSQVRAELLTLEARLEEEVEVLDRL